MFWEIRKSIGIFSIAVIVLVALLCGRLLYRAADVGFIYVYDKDFSRRYTGWEVRDINEKHFERFEGRVMDDDFFVELNLYYKPFEIPPDGKPDFENQPMGTSLYDFLHSFPTNGKHVIGEIFTDVESTFGIDPPVLVYTDGWNTANDYME